MNQPYTCTTHFTNSKRDVSASHTADQLFAHDDCATAREVIKQWAGYKPTELLSLGDIATEAGVAKVLYKDESQRLGLGSFKALGGAYAVGRVAQQYADAGHDKPLVVCTATDGNHGRSVSSGAQRLGIECHIFIHAEVSQNRADSMAELGAIIHRVDGNYDDSIAECIKVSEQHGWQIVSDTSWEDYREIPTQVMAGYTVLAAEIVEQLQQQENADQQIPTHIILQAGCGGMAGALMGYFWQQWREQLPEIIIVESKMSDCVYQSLKADNIVLVDIVEETLMAGLSCGEVSQLAWPLIQRGVSHVITIDDSGVAPMMRWLAQPSGERPAIEAGECSASGLIGLMAIQNDPELATATGINKDSRVLVIGTEGATDKALYEQMIAGA